jgi:hypothetical protein
MRRLLIMLVLTLVTSVQSACERCRIALEADDVLTLDTSLPPGTSNGLEVPPEPVLASLWVPQAMNPRKPGTWHAFGERILQDGTVWFHQDARDGMDPLTFEPRDEPAELAWWFDGYRLTPREVRQLAESIRRLGLMDLLTDPPPSEQTIIGSSEVIWTLSIDNRPSHDVRVFHGQPRPGLDRFKEIFEHAIFNAMMRWKRDRGVPIGTLDPLREP